MALPDFDSMWDYNDPAATEQKFREILPQAERSADRSYHAQLLTQIARTQSLQRQFDAAHATLDQAQSLLGDDPTATVRYLLERGRTFNSSKKQAEALPLFMEAWEKAQAAGLDGYAVDAAHMVAIADSANSLEWNLKAIDYAEQSTLQEAKRWLGSLYNNTGWSYFDMGDLEQALDIFKRALDWHETHGKPNTIRIARWTIARTLRELGQLQEALKIQQRLLGGAEDEPDGYVHEEMAELLHALGQVDEAKPHFSRAYERLSQDPWLMDNEAERVERLKTMGA